MGMAGVFHKIVTRALPAGATIVGEGEQRQARWTDSRGRRRSARVTTGKSGQPRIICQAKTYTARYRDGLGQPREEATGCRTYQAAMARLTELLRRAELVRGHGMSAEESQVLATATSPIGDHLDAWVGALLAKGDSEEYRRMSRRYLDILRERLRWRYLSDITRSSMERWLAGEAASGRSARSRNAHLVAASSFCAWCAQTSRLVNNPLAPIARANEQADRRRIRRALSPEELQRLLLVARLRPLAEYGRTPVGPEGKKGRRRKHAWTWSALTAETIGQAATAGREHLARRPRQLAALEEAGALRAVVYKTLALTGLRRNELASIRLADADLRRGVLVLRPRDEKARRGATIPLPGDLAADLRELLALRLRNAQERARFRLLPIPLALDPEAPLVPMPDGLLRILGRDLVAAGLARRVKAPSGRWAIDTRDDRGRTLDIHALRTTFGTLLAAAGVPLRTAQEALRHSDPRLTANIYTDPRLLDVEGAVAALPRLPISASVAPDVAQAVGLASPSQSLPVPAAISRAAGAVEKPAAITPTGGGGSVANPHRDVAWVGEAENRGDWIRTSDLLTPSQSDASSTREGDQPVAGAADASCPDCCTAFPSAAAGDLAARLLALSADERRSLLSLLDGRPSPQ